MWFARGLIEAMEATMPRMSLLKAIVLALGIGAVTGACAPAGAQLPNVDPVVISPQYYTVLLDSNHVRVLETGCLRANGKQCTDTRTTWSTSSRRLSSE